MASNETYMVRVYDSFFNDVCFELVLKNYDEDKAIKVAFDTFELIDSYYTDEVDLLIRTLDGSYQMIGYIESDEDGCNAEFVEAFC